MCSLTVTGNRTQGMGSLEYLFVLKAEDVSFRVPKPL